MSKITPRETPADNRPPPEQLQMYPPPPQPVMAQPSSTTAVVIQQNAAPAVKPLRGWNSGLWECCSDPKSCFLVLCCPVCHACMLSSRMGESCCLPICMPGTWLIALRTKLRTQEGIQGSIAGDCCDVYCYGNLVECQLARELDYLDSQVVVQQTQTPTVAVISHQ